MINPAAFSIFTMLYSYYFGLLQKYIITLKENPITIKHLLPVNPLMWPSPSGLEGKVSACNAGDPGST